MPPEITFIVVTAVVATLVGVATLIAVWRDRAGRGLDEPPVGILERVSPAFRSQLDAATAGGPAYGAAVRIMWWVSIAGVLVGVGLTDAFRENQAAVYGLGAVAVAVAVILHDVLPARWRTPLVVALEVLSALALVTALLVLTGYGGSPFAYAYSIVAVAVSLALGPRLAFAVAALATVSYLGVLALDPEVGSYGGADLLRVGLTIGSVWLLAYLAGVFAANERRNRAAAIELSRIDPLTGLMNRGQLFPMLEQEVQRTRRSERGFCLLMIDLDGLKAVNDTHGHHRGDEVLRGLGGIIRRSIRSVDTAYRYGGDEFLVLLPETDFAGAFVVAEKIRAGAEEVGLATGRGELLTSVSIGLVSCPEDGTSAEELMIAVDRAMYQAKSLGKNQVSGNPRPRRLVSYALPPSDEPTQPDPMPAPPPEVAPEPGAPQPAAAASPAPRSATVAPAAEIQPEPRQPSRPASTAASFGAARPVPAATLDRPATGNGTQEPGGDDEPDPSEVRRHIAAARLHMDPDHQIRRAMDAFLSPPSRRED